MVVGAFPVAKLGALLLKQVSKPLANAVKNRAKTNPFFRTYVCMPPAQFYHWCEVKLKMWVMNLGKPVNIPKLNENQAIELGAELLGEGLIFVIAAGIIMNEFLRQSKKEAIKEEARLDELCRIQDELKELYFSKAKTDAQLREMTRVLHSKFPDVSFNAEALQNFDTIPDHHRYETEEVVESSFGLSIWNGLKSTTSSVYNNVVEFLPQLPQSQSKSSTNQNDTPSTSQKLDKSSVKVKASTSAADNKTVVIIEKPTKPDIISSINSNKDKWNVEPLRLHNEHSPKS